MKNFQKLVLGLIVVGCAFGFSAFTNAKSVNVKANKAFAVPFDYLVQRAIGAFTQVNTSNNSAVPNYLACSGAATTECSYIVTTAGKSNIPTLASLGQTSYTTAQINDYLTKATPWLALDPNSGPALYTN